MFLFDVFFVFSFVCFLLMFFNLKILNVIILCTKEVQYYPLVYNNNNNNNNNSSSNSSSSSSSNRD